MSYSTGRARMEAQLAVAHRALHRAQGGAEEAGDDGATEDIAQLLKEVTRIAERSLSDKPRRGARAAQRPGL